MTKAGDKRNNDIGWNAANAQLHPNKIRHKRRPCGAGPGIPTNLTFTWDIIEQSRGHRLQVLLNWSPVRTDGFGEDAVMDRYVVQLQRSVDEGVTVAGKTRKFVVPEATVVSITDASIVSGTIAEFTTDKTHDMDTGDTVIISGITPVAYNGTGIVLAAGLADKKFRVDIGTSPVAATAFGEAHQDVTSREVRGIRKHVWYRFRVQAVTKAGCRGIWSAWTLWTLANDHVAPATPLLVTISSGANRVVVEWEPPLVYLPIEGTAGGTIGTATVTGIGTFFTSQCGLGGKIRLGNAGDIRTVIAIASDTSLTVDTNLSATVATKVVYLEETDPDVAYYDTWVGTTVGFTPPAYKRSRTHHSTRISFKPKDADLGSTFYARIASSDASRNRSVWIPATVAGNSSPGATAEGVVVGGAGGARYSITFTKPGRLRVRHYPYRWQNTSGKTLTFEMARAIVGIHDGATHPNDGCPTGVGGTVGIQLYRWDTSEVSTKLFVADNKLKVDPDSHRDTIGVTGFDNGITTLLDGEQVSFFVKAVGTTFPGEDLVVQVHLRE